MNLILRILAAALLFASVANASEDDRDRDGPKIDLFGSVDLTLESGARFRPRGLVAWSPGGSLEVAIPGRVVQRDENRINIRWLPVLGDLTQPTTASEFSGALDVGAAWRVDDMLVIGPDANVPPSILTDGVRTVIVANGERAFEIPVDFGNDGAPYLGDLPVLGNLFRIGRVQRAKDSLLVIVRPSLVNPRD